MADGLCSGWKTVHVRIHRYVRSSLDILTWLTWVTPQVVIGGRGGKCVSAHM